MRGIMVDGGTEVGVAGAAAQVADISDAQVEGTWRRAAQPIFHGSLKDLPMLAGIAMFGEPVSIGPLAITGRSHRFLS